LQLTKKKALLEWLDYGKGSFHIFYKLFLHEKLTIPRFAVNLPSPSREIETTTLFQTLPPLNWIKAYMSWRLETGTPRLGAKITVNTLLKEFEQLRV
jgi:hypothetical protein